MQQANHQLGHPRVAFCFVWHSFATAAVGNVQVDWEEELGEIALGAVEAKDG